jgi:hypothetical protein
MRSRTHTLLFLSFLLAPQAAMSTQEFCIEDGSLSNIPAAAEKAVRKTGEVSPECKLVGMSINLKAESAGKDVIVTTDNACEWGAATGPIWVLREGQGSYDVVLSYSGYSAYIGKHKHKGFNNIKISAGTAGWYQESLWKFNGEKYKKIKEYSGPPR